MPFIALLGLWGAVELATLIFAVIKIGFFPTIALLVLSSAAGSYLLRSQQQAVLRMGQTQNRDVARESVYRLTAGVLLLVPGFISSILALIFLIPPLRVLFASTLLRIVQPQAVYSAFSWQQQTYHADNDGVDAESSQENITATREDGSVIHGELIDKRGNPHD